MLMEFNGRPVLWGAIAGMLLSLMAALSLFQDGKAGIALFWLFPSAFFGTAVWIIMDSNRRVAELTKLLVEKRSEISNGEIYFHDQLLRRDTRMVQFRVHISMAIVTYTLTTRPILYSRNKPWFFAIMVSLLGLLLGIWSYRGLVGAPISAYENLTFAGSKSIGDLTDQIEAWGRPVKIAS